MFDTERASVFRDVLERLHVLRPLDGEQRLLPGVAVLAGGHDVAARALAIGVEARVAQRLPELAQPFLERVDLPLDLLQPPPQLPHLRVDAPPMLRPVAGGALTHLRRLPRLREAAAPALPTRGRGGGPSRRAGVRKPARPPPPPRLRPGADLWLPGGVRVPPVV